MHERPSAESIPDEGITMKPSSPPRFVGFDLDPSRRPGVPAVRRVPEMLPNTQYPPVRQTSGGPHLMHGRPNKQFPPVFGTDMPPHGAAGAIRTAAYKY